MIQKQLKTWSSASRCTWFTFATLIGESDTRHRDSSGADATRTVFAVWILYCVIIAASYSGALKAFLTLPVYQPPINTLQDVLDSGLPWGMVRPPPKNVSAKLIGSRYKSRYLKVDIFLHVQVLYGEEEEQMMASSPEGSVIRTIWDEKIVNT